MPNDSKTQRLRRGLHEQQQTRAANAKTAVDSVTNFILELLRPVVKGVVESVMGWLQKLFW